MALITIDSKTLHTEVKVGILENYSPDNEVRDIYKEVESLKEKVKNKLKKIVGENKSDTEILVLIKNDEKKRDKWVKYLETTYNKQLSNILEKIKKKNEEICPGYSDMIKNHSK